MSIANKLAVFGCVLFGSCAVCAHAAMHRDIEFAKPGGVSLTLDASVPEFGVAPYPAAIIVHGGGFTKGDKQTFVTPLFKPLADARFVWFSINYRLAPQYTMPDAVADVTAAVEWVHAHAAEYKVDPRRIALVGESAGAYLVDYVAVKGPKEARVAAVVSFYGPHDLVYQVKEKGQGKISEGLAAFTGVPEMSSEGEKRLREMSPSNLLHRRLPPFLLIHGTEDEQVPFEQSVLFRRQLQDHGARCELFSVEGGKHGVGSWEKNPAQQEYKSKMVDWLRETLQ